MNGPGRQHSGGSKKKTIQKESFGLNKWGAIYRRFGLTGLLVAAISFIWWNWDTISARPGINWFVKEITRERLPRCDRDGFCVALMHLENDDKAEYENLLVAEMTFLGEDGISLLRIDRVMSYQGSKPEERIHAAHTLVKGYLGEAQARLAIWGTVLRRDGHGTPFLFWTPNADLELPHAYGYYDPQGIRLPEAFWSDFALALRLLIYREFTQFKAAHGQYVADRLTPFATRVGAMLNESRFLKLDDESRYAIRMIYADAVVTLAEQSSDSGRFNVAIENYRKAALEQPLDISAARWSAAQNGLGVALRDLAERGTGTELLEESISVFDDALRGRPRPTAPLQWAETMENLGISQRSLGEREVGTARFLEAIDTFKTVLEVRKSTEHPTEWANSEFDLGNAYRALADREAGTQSLVLAVAAFRAALAKRDKAKAPLDWALTQEFLGTSLRMLGERSHNIELLKESAEAHRQALTERTRARVPLAWALSENNLGETLCAIGEYGNDPASLNAAVAAFELALSERDRRAVPLHWASTQKALGTALRIIGKRAHDLDKLKASASAYREALKEFGPSSMKNPASWASVEDNLGVTLTDIAEQTKAADTLKEAIAAFELALTFRAQDPQSIILSGAARHLSNAQALLNSW